MHANTSIFLKTCLNEDITVTINSRDTSPYYRCGSRAGIEIVRYRNRNYSFHKTNGKAKFSIWTDTD